MRSSIATAPEAEQAHAERTDAQKHQRRRSGNRIRGRSAAGERITLVVRQALNVERDAQATVDVLLPARRGLIVQVHGGDRAAQRSYGLQGELHGGLFAGAETFERPTV